MTIVSPPTASNGPSAVAPPPAGAERAGAGRALRAIIVKELRQNLAFLVLAILLETIVLLVAEWFRSGFLLSGLSPGFENVLLLSGVRGSITLGCVVAGLMLGIFQPLADRNFDLWAFLIHRPVSRGLIFAGRAIAGLILYFIAAGLPLVCLVAFAMTPSGGKVFLWTYTVPPAVDFLSGIACYFAVLLAMDRRALAYGSKSIPVIVAIFATVFALVCVSAWSALTVDVFVIVALATAAAGSVVSHGYSLHAPRVARVALGLVLFFGFSVLAFMTATGGVAHVWHSRLDASSYQTSREPYEVRRHVLMSDGNFYLLVSAMAWDKNRGEFMVKSMKYLDLQGRQVNPEANKAEPVGTIFDFGWQTVYQSQRRFGSTYRDLPMDAERGITIGAYEYEWWAVNEKKIFYVYRRPAAWQPDRLWEFYGTVGVAGLARSSMGAVPFTSPQLDFEYILTPDTLYQLDMDNFNVTPIFKAKPGETLHRWEKDFWFNTQYWEGSLVILTSQRLVRLSPRHEVTAQIPVHDIEGNHIDCSRFTTPEGEPRWAVSYSPWKTWGREKATRNWEIFDSNGNLLSKTSVDWLSERGPPYVPVPLSSEQKREITLGHFEIGVWAAAANPLLATFSSAMLASRLSEPQYSRPTAVLIVPFHSTSALIGGLAMMTICGVVTWLVAKRYGLKWAVAWAIGGFLFGPAMLLTVIALHSFPRKQQCPQCGRPRPIGREKCPACGQPWPPAVRNGTEIFA